MNGEELVEKLKTPTAIRPLDPVHREPLVEAPSDSLGPVDCRRVWHRDQLDV